MGEHAVLQGKAAVVCAIDRRLCVTLTPRADQHINIHSTTLGRYQTAINNFMIAKPFLFVLTAIERYKNKLSVGCDLLIDSEFSDQTGLGSSGAVTVATLTVLSQWLGLPLSKHDLLTAAKQVIQQAQGGVGSGADAAASIFGGVVLYEADPVSVEVIAYQLPLTLVYSGSKMSTPAVVRQVQKLHEQYPVVVNAVYAAICACVQEGVNAIRRSNWPRLGEVMNIHQGLLDALCVSNQLLTALINALRTYPAIYGAKISGSGLGDCVVGLGELPNDTFPLDEEQQDAGVSQVAVRVSKGGILSH